MRGKIKNQIEYCLKNIPETRNSDIRLMIEVWQKYYPQFMKRGSTDKVGIWLEALYDLPSQDNIKRMRAHFQNDLKMYLPTIWEVAKQRKILEQEWKQYMLDLNTFKRL